MENIWFLLVIVFVTIEIMTVQLVSLWFACAAALSLIACHVDAPVIVQFIIFVASSGIFCWLFAKYGRGFILKTKVATGADGLIGKQGTIVKTSGGFRVLPEGESCDWKVECPNGGLLPNACVRIKDIRGVTLIVEPIGSDEIVKG